MRCSFYLHTSCYIVQNVHRHYFIGGEIVFVSRIIRSTYVQSIGVERRVSFIAGVIPQSLQLEAQVTLASLKADVTSGETARRAVRLCSRNVAVALIT